MASISGSVDSSVLLSSAIMPLASSICRVSVVISEAMIMKGSPTVPRRAASICALRFKMFAASAIVSIL